MVLFNSLPAEPTCEEWLAALNEAGNSLEADENDPELADEAFMIPRREYVEFASVAFMERDFSTLRAVLDAYWNFDF